MAASEGATLDDVYERLRKVSDILSLIHDELVLIRTGTVGDGFIDANGNFNRRSGSLNR